jgi:hypothetical protein
MMFWLACATPSTKPTTLPLASWTCGEEEVQVERAGVGQHLQKLLWRSNALLLLPHRIQSIADASVRRNVWNPNVRGGATTPTLSAAGRSWSESSILALGGFLPFSLKEGNTKSSSLPYGVSRRQLSR